MNQEDLSKRLDIIERTLNQTKTYAQFSGVVAILTGLAVLIWGYMTLQQYLPPMAEGTIFSVIGLTSFLLAAGASIYKTRKKGQPIFSYALRQILIQGIPFALIAIASMIWLRETTPLFFPLIQLLYGLFIWSCRLLVPKPVSTFGLVIILCTMVQFFTGITAVAYLEVYGAMLTLGLGHIITGFILYRHGHA